MKSQWIWNVGVGIGVVLLAVLVVSGRWTRVPDKELETMAEHTVSLTDANFAAETANGVV